MAVELSLYDPGLTYLGQKQFDCGNPVINAFVRGSLKPQVKKNLSVAYVLTDAEQSGQLVGFYTLAQYAVSVALLSSLQIGSLPRSIPCSRLVMLGVDVRYQKRHFGSKLMKHALAIIDEVAKKIGSFGVYLDADATALHFYEALGFRLLTGNLSPQPSPMFLARSAMVARI